MANLNKVFLIGNLTRDPELRYTPSGTAVVDFGMAINRKWTSHSGEKQEEVVFLDLQAWARSAEVISEYCKKGAPLFVEGRLKLDSWEGKDGQKRSKLRVVVDNFQFIGAPTGRNAPDEDAEGRPANPPPRGRPRAPDAGAPPPEDAAPSEPPPENPPAAGQFKVNDDIPF